MRKFSGESFAEVYGDCCHKLVNNYENIISPRGQKIKEIENAIIEITNPFDNLFKNKVRDLPEKYLKSELKLYFSGTNKAQGFIDASKFWDNIKNNDGTVNSAYGYLLFKEKNEYGKTQWSWGYNQLRNDKDTRQALMFMGRPRTQYDGVKDFICTTSYQFMIRNDMLNMTVNRRSQDVFFGLTYDVPWELLLMQQMQLHLRPTYPDLKVGKYTLHCTSFHLYEKDFEIVQKMLKYPFQRHRMPQLKNSMIYITGEPMPNFAGNDEFREWLDA